MWPVFPFVVQGVLMGADEVLCHYRREVRRWERVGHPLDTLTFLICLFWLLWQSPGEFTRTVYVGLAVFSCLFISKDEWQHRELCSGFENWLHALLFMLHPVLLFWAGWLWWSRDAQFRPVIGIAAVATAAFALYQATFWNFLRHDR